MSKNDVNRSADLDFTSGYLYPEGTQRELKRWRVYSKIRARYWGLILSIATPGVTSFPYVDQADSQPIPLAKKIRLSEEDPLIVVANHSSHADTALLMATLGRCGRPLLFTAAGDYWLKGRLNRFVGKYLVGLWPVRRKGGMEDMRKASNAIKGGAILVVFPEGTRTRNGLVGEFHIGAYHLAAETGAKILPIALHNTGKVLPVHGRVGRAPLEVRYGKAVSVNPGEESKVAEETRLEIIDLLKNPTRNSPGFGWSRVNKIASSWIGLAIVFCWAFGEGVSWPLLAEMPLMLLVVTVGRKWQGVWLILASALGSTLGILTTWYLVSRGHNPPSPLTTPRMHSTALRQMMANPHSAFWYQTYNGIPVKVYAHMAGQVHLSFFQVLLSMAPRILRIFIIGGATWMLGRTLARFLRSCLGLIQSFCLLVFPFALYTVISLWS